MGVAPGEAIYKTLAATVAISDVVATRIFHGYAKQGTARPHLIIQRTSQTHDPAHGTLPGLFEDIWQVTATSDVSLEQAQSLADLVVSALHGRTNIAGCSAFILEDQNDVSTPPINSTDRAIHQVFSSFWIMHRGQV